jgi:hypothetical protein
MLPFVVGARRAPTLPCRRSCAVLPIAAGRYSSFLPPPSAFLPRFSFRVNGRESEGLLVNRGTAPNPSFSKQHPYRVCMRGGHPRSSSVHWVCLEQTFFSFLPPPPPAKKKPPPPPTSSCFKKNEGKPSLLSSLLLDAVASPQRPPHSSLLHLSSSSSSSSV